MAPYPSMTFGAATKRRPGGAVNVSLPSVRGGKLVAGQVVIRQ